MRMSKFLKLMAADVQDEVFLLYIITVRLYIKKQDFIFLHKFLQEFINVIQYTLYKSYKSYIIHYVSHKSRIIHYISYTLYTI